MNIWIFNHYAIPPQLPGGTRHFDMGRELVNRGHQVTIFASSFHHYSHREAKLAADERWRIEEIEGVRFVWVRTHPYSYNNWHRVINMLAYATRATKLGKGLCALKPELGRPDVVIGSSVHLLAVWAAYRVAKTYQAKFVMEVRDIWPQTIIELGVCSPKSPTVIALRWLERFLYQRADTIITSLPKSHGYFTSMGIPEQRIKWIPNGVPLSGDFVCNGEKRDGKFRLIYLGSHGMANALDVILDAAKIVQSRAHSSIQFILIGDGAEKINLIERAQKLGLTSVEFRDPVHKSDVPRVLQEADAAVLVLRDLSVYKYGISTNKLLDYMAAAKPVIFAGSVEDNPVESSGCGLCVPPASPEALAAAILEISALSQKARDEMGLRGRKYIEQWHSMQALGDRLISAISCNGAAPKSSNIVE
ncbi:glycosyltransferase family 4 protein [Candidatus Acetothermia bacterium]|nr:glycosyltransferase family 4 protein [Candidatus Acetothermia bacterium]